MKKQGSGVRGQKLTAQVREVLADLQEATKAEIGERLGVQTEADLHRIDLAVKGLVKTGEAAAIGLNEQGEPIPAFQPLKYRWVTSLVKARGAVQARLWRFACHRFQTARPFTVAEAAGMAGAPGTPGCDRDYTKRYFRWLWKSGYLAIVSRGRAGAPLYQVVGGKEHEPAPPWNRRAERRKSVGQAPSPAVLSPPASPSPQPSPVGGEGAEDHRPEARPTILVPEELQKFAANMRQAFAEFYRGMRHLAAHFPQVESVLREMEEDLGRIAKEQGHDEPGEPADGHH